jgi:hypothetical protein
MDRRCAMATGVSLKKRGVVLRMVDHPVGAFLGGAAAAVVCGVLGMVYGEVAAAVMAALGIVVGAPLGAMTAASAHNEA